jgi:hypothetical protein
MWLLDVNVDVSLERLLKAKGILVENTISRGWRELTNGNLVTAAVDSGFTCLITRDVDFAKSAEKALKDYDKFAAVVLTLPQARRKDWLEHFEKICLESPITPIPGKLIFWPDRNK